MIFGKSRVLNKFGRWIYGKPGIGVPGNFTYTVINQNTVKFTWTEAENATGYKIYDENDVLLADVGNLLYWQETGYVLNQPKIRKVVAYTTGMTSDPLIVEAIITMPAPTLSVKSYKHSRIVWRWTASNSYAIGYRIYSDTGVLIADVGNLLEYEESNLEAQTTYKRYVVAYSNTEVEAESSVITRTTSAVPVPQSFAASVDSNYQISFSWTTSEADLDGFKIYDTNNTLIADVPGAGSRAKTVNGFTPNTEFGFYIVAYYKTKISNQSSDSVVITLATQPTISGLTELNNIDAGIGVSINDYDNPDYTIYEIYCFTTGETIYTGSTLSFDHRNLTIDTTYQYQVRAKNLGNIYTGYSSIVSKKCTYPIRIQLAGGVTKVFNTAVNLELVAPDGYTAGMVVVDSINHGICDSMEYDKGVNFDETDLLFDYKFQDTFVYDNGDNNYSRKDVQPFNSTISYTLPSRHSEIDIQVVFLNSEGRFTPKYSTKVTYFKTIERPQLYVGQISEGIKIEATNLNPGGYGYASSNHVLDGTDKTYVPKSITGLEKNLIATINGQDLLITDDNWNCMSHLQMPKTYIGICFDYAENCIWLATGTVIEKWRLADNGYSIVDLGISFSVSTTGSICTDSSYIYNVSETGIIKRWTIGGSVDADTIDINALSPNASTNKGIDYYNGTLYLGSGNGYLHVVDIMNWYSPNLSSEINTSLTVIDKLCIDGFYVYVSKNGESLNYRYTLAPRMDVYKSSDNVNFTLFAEDVGLKIMDTTENTDVPPKPTITSSSHAVATPSADTTVDISIAHNAAGISRNVYYYIVAHDPYGHFTNPSDDIAATLVIIISGYVVVWDTSPSTVPGSAINQTQQTLTSAPLPNGDNYIHVRTVASSGFAGEVTHLGPFRIDTRNPNILGVAMTPNPVGANQTLLVQVAVSDL